VGYSVWVPRRHGVAMIPPAPDDGQAVMFTLETRPFGGPQRQGDVLANHNPIVTDLMMSKWWERVLPCADASKAKPEDLTRDSQHVWQGRVHSFNAAYADGHVERLRADEVRPRFMSAGGNWAWR
jgi:prepilin-type processing-associated H-X9-DG protein